MDEQKPVKLVKPAQVERKLTQEEQLQIKAEAFEKKQSEERERVKALRKKKNEMATVEVEPPAEEDSCETPDSEVIAYAGKKGKYQRELCKKYGIKRKQLQRAIEEAKKLFVARLTVSFNSKIVVAIVDLLEFGDI